MFGTDTGNDIVMSLFIDDGVPNRGHRVNLFNASFKEMGTNTGTHSSFRTMNTAVYACDFK